jgi:hypothetical protein
MIEIHLELMSDATFGRGDGVSGLVDQEVEHDSQTGLPLVRGRTLKGLLVEGCADLFYALEQDQGVPDSVRESAKYLFGEPGSSLETTAQMQVGTAQFPSDLRQAVYAKVVKNELSPTAVLQSLTTVRRQTAVDNTSDTPEKGSLRSMRVLLRETELVAPLTFTGEIEAHLPLLAACVAAVRRGGIGRNRGRGRLSARLWQNSEDVTDKWLDRFAVEIGV